MVVLIMVIVHFMKNNETNHQNLAVSITRGVYYCFACHSNGDAISFIRNKLNMTESEAIEFLLNKYSLHDKISYKKIILRVRE
jgi:DNA primase